MTIFSNADLPKEGFNHESLVYNIATKKGKYVPMVLLDNGSGLNVCPLKVASCPRLGPTNFASLNQTVKAYDNLKKDVLKVVTLDVTIGPT